MTLAEFIENDLERCWIILGGLVWIAVPFVFNTDPRITVLMVVGGIIMVSIGAYAFWKFRIRKLEDIQL